MRMELGGERSVGSIGEEQKAVNSVDVNDKKQTQNDKLKKSAEGSENREKGVDYKEQESQNKGLKANSDCKDETEENSDKETEEESVGNKDKSQDKETEEETKKSKGGVKNEAVNEEDKAKVRVAGHVKGPGKAKRKIVKMEDSFEEPDRYATPRASWKEKSCEDGAAAEEREGVEGKVELQEADSSQTVKICELQKQKAQEAKSRSRKSIVVDGDDAYSCRSREILQEVKWRADRYSEKLEKLEKENGMTTYEKMKLARKENPILGKRIDDEMESARPQVEDVESFIDKLRKERKGLYYDDEDLYGSDDSDTETRMKEPPRRNKSVPQEKVNDVMESRRADILKQMSEENEKIDEITRKQEEMRRFASRSTKYQYDY